MQNESQLAELAGKANELHTLVTSSLQHASLNAWHCGQLLSKAREQVPHGEWQQWIEEHCAFGIGTAQRYIRIGKLSIDNVGDKTISQCLKLLVPKKKKEPTCYAPTSGEIANPLEQFFQLAESIHNKLSTFEPVPNISLKLKQKKISSDEARYCCYVIDRSTPEERAAYILPRHLGQHLSERDLYYLIQLEQEDRKMVFERWHEKHYTNESILQLVKSEFKELYPKLKLSKGVDSPYKSEKRAVTHLRSKLLSLKRTQQWVRELVEKGPRNCTRSDFGANRELVENVEKTIQGLEQLRCSMAGNLNGEAVRDNVLDGEQATTRLRKSTAELPPSHSEDVLDQILNGSLPTDVNQSDPLIDKLLGT